VEFKQGQLLRRTCCFLDGMPPGLCIFKSARPFDAPGMPQLYLTCVVYSLRHAKEIVVSLDNLSPVHPQVSESEV
jgi:hypothetical protein